MRRSASWEYDIECFNRCHGQDDDREREFRNQDRPIGLSGESEMDHTLLPAEFREALESGEFGSDDAQDLWEFWQDASSSRDPDLLAFDPEAYPAPVETLLLLYRQQPERFNSRVLEHLGSESRCDFWMNVSAAARDAFDCQDYYLLGQLAFRMERALAERELEAGPWAAVFADADPVTIERRMPTETLQEKLIQAFDRALNRNHRHVSPQQVSHAALGYFEAMPEAMVIPREVFSKLTPDRFAWNLLWLFATEDRTVLGSAAELLDRYATLPHPTLRRAVPLEEGQVVEFKSLKALRNPFTKLAGKIPRKLRRRRQRQAMQEEIVLAVPEEELELEADIFDDDVQGWDDDVFELPEDDSGIWLEEEIDLEEVTELEDGEDEREPG
jgi:hypothetical protein